MTLFGKVLEARPGMPDYKKLPTWGIKLDARIRFQRSYACGPLIYAELYIGGDPINHTTPQWVTFGYVWRAAKGTYELRDRLFDALNNATLSVEIALQDPRGPQVGLQELATKLVEQLR